MYDYPFYFIFLLFHILTFHFINQVIYQNRYKYLIPFLFVVFDVFLVFVLVLLFLLHHYPFLNCNCRNKVFKFKFFSRNLIFIRYISELHILVNIVVFFPLFSFDFHCLTFHAFVVDKFFFHFVLLN